MEKRAVISPQDTPHDRPSSTDKDKAKVPTVEELEQHPMKKMAKAVESHVSDR
jgi:hypothetical protein